MNASQPTPKAQLSTLLSRFPPQIVALARRCLTKLRHAFPGSYELVYDYSNSLVVSFSMFVAISDELLALLRRPDATAAEFCEAVAAAPRVHVFVGRGEQE